MGGLECVITGLMDEFCLFFAGKKYAREIFTLCAIFVSFTVATINVTPVSSQFFTVSLLKHKKKKKERKGRIQKLWRCVSTEKFLVLVLIHDCIKWIYEMRRNLKESVKEKRHKLIRLSSTYPQMIFYDE